MHWYESMGKLYLTIWNISSWLKQKNDVLTSWFGEWRPYPHHATTPVTPVMRGRDLSPHLRRGGGRDGGPLAVQAI